LSGSFIPLFSFGGVFVNAVSGTGATKTGLKMQFFVIVVYLVYVFGITHFTNLSVAYVWLGEIIYWAVMLAMVVWYLRSGKWRGVDV
jgi:multidrug resistance protein, MATE family